MKKIVIALGGNALQRPGEMPTAENQYRKIAASVQYIADLAAAGHEIVIAHGNGPQVGRIVRQNYYAQDVTPAMPFDVCGAMSQGMIGYQLQQCLQNELNSRGIPRQSVTVVTQVLVDPLDPGFQNPSKPIGEFYSYEEAMAQKKANPTFDFREDAGRGWRRVVASPMPVDILEFEAIQSLTEQGFIPIAVGGGGIPTARGKDGRIQGVEAVVDKDLSAELLAEKLDADILMILTAVDYVCLHYGKPDEKKLEVLSVSKAQSYIEAGEFPPGSMLPKINAAIRFAQGKPGRKTVITSLEHIREALMGVTGTTIVA